MYWRLSLTILGPNLHSQSTELETFSKVNVDNPLLAREVMLSYANHRHRAWDSRVGTYCHVDNAYFCSSSPVPAPEYTVRLPSPLIECILNHKPLCGDTYTPDVKSGEVWYWLGSVNSVGIDTVYPVSEKMNGKLFTRKDKCKLSLAKRRSRAISNNCPRCQALSHRIILGTESAIIVASNPASSSGKRDNIPVMMATIY